MSALVLEYVKLVWSPQVTITAIVAGVVVVFLCLNRAQISERIAHGGVSFKGPGGIGLDIAAQQQATGVGQQAVQTAQQQAQQAQQQQLTQQALERITRWWLFERIYRYIFQSQIHLLRNLEHQPARTAPWTQLFTFYKQGVLDRGVEATTYPFQNYMLFLRNWNLVQWVVHPGAAEADVTLSQFGIEFLRYIEQNNYNVLELPH